MATAPAAKSTKAPGAASMPAPAVTLGVALSEVSVPGTVSPSGVVPVGGVVGESVLPVWPPEALPPGRMV